jgi:hypothetical protein
MGRNYRVGAGTVKMLSERTRDGEESGRFDMDQFTTEDRRQKHAKQPPNDYRDTSSLVIRPLLPLPGAKKLFYKCGPPCKKARSKPIYAYCYLLQTLRSKNCSKNMCSAASTDFPLNWTSSRLLAVSDSFPSIQAANSNSP